MSPPTTHATQGVPGAPRRVMTEDEWAALGDDEPGEFVAGELVEEELADIVHEVVIMWLSTFVGAWLLPRGGVFGGAGRFLTRARYGRKTDLFVFLPGSAKPRRRGASRRPPDIVIEVVSPTPRDVRRDRIEKMAEYAEFGVRWYWIVDPDARTLEIHERGANALYVHLLGASDGAFDVPACPARWISRRCGSTSTSCRPTKSPEAASRGRLHSKSGSGFIDRNSSRTSPPGPTMSALAWG